MKCSTHNRSGFSLLELLIVIGIIAILAGILLTTFSGSSESARAAQCLNNMRSLSNAVIAYATDTTDYPAASSYQYCTMTDGRFHNDYLKSGWIGWHKVTAKNSRGSLRKISPYYDDEGKEQFYAITNGALWRYIKGGRNSYACPAHILESRRVAQLTPAWSYVMNSYFGWQYNDKPAPTCDTRARDTRGTLPFYYRNKDGKETSSGRDPSKVLLFAELPFVDVEGGKVQKALISKGTGQELDPALQYSSEGESRFLDAHNCAAKSSPESIGFNHKGSKKGEYMAHVAFADGHVEKIPLRGGSSDIEKLTTFLCVGHGYTLTASGYEKAE